MLVAFEGTEGSGKSTQLRLVSKTLQQDGHDVVCTREPGGTALGESIRSLLLDSSATVSPEAEAYLMTGARAEHVRQVIQPALEHGSIVLTDRYFHSTLAYQGAGRNLDLGILRQMQGLAVGSAIPDIVILIDIDVQTGLQRRRNHGHLNRLDREDREFHQRVADWYRREAQNCPEYWTVVQGDQRPEAVCGEIMAVLKNRLDCVQSAALKGATR